MLADWLGTHSRTHTHRPNNYYGFFRCVFNYARVHWHVHVNNKNAHTYNAKRETAGSQDYKRDYVCAADGPDREKKIMHILHRIGCDLASFTHYGHVGKWIILGKIYHSACAADSPNASADEGTSLLLLTQIHTYLQGPLCIKSIWVPSCVFFSSAKAENSQN